MKEVTEYNFQDKVIKRLQLLPCAGLILVAHACALSHSLINHVGVTKLPYSKQFNGESYMAWKGTETLEAC